MKRLLLIVNPRASRFSTTFGGAVARLVEKGFDLDIRTPSDRSETVSMVAAGSRDADTIVVAGGDGTVNAALPALIEARRPVGLVPCGTANDLALTLGIPVDPLAAADVIAEGVTRHIDVGRVNAAHFVNVASVGLSVEIAERQDETLKKQWGVLSYAIATIATLKQAEPFPALVACDGTAEEVRAFQIAVGNGVHYGGGLKVSPGAEIDDGMLDVYAIQTASIPELIALAPSLLDGTLVDRDDVAVYRGRTVRIETPMTMPVNTDGEVTTETPAEFSILRRALEVIVPKPPA